MNYRNFYRRQKEDLSATEFAADLRLRCEKQELQSVNKFLDHLDSVELFIGYRTTPQGWAVLFDQFCEQEKLHQ